MGLAQSLLENFDLQGIASPPSSDERPLVVVRVRTSHWHDSKGIHVRRDLLYLKTWSRGHNYLADDAANIGAGELVPIITNFNDVSDGIYEVAVSGVSTDWETGYVDHYEYELVPFGKEVTPDTTPMP